MRLCDLPALVLDLLYPPQCLHCGVSLFLHHHAFLCPDCEKIIPWIGENACRFCGEPLGEHSIPVMGCRRCRPNKLAFTRAAAAAVYHDTPAASLVKSFKFGGNRRLATPLADALAPVVARKILAETRIDIITAVPLHPEREIKRGYNQAALLAKEISRRLQLPFRNDIVRRIRNTAAQARLSSAERLSNISGAFAAAAAIPGSQALLIDDVMTTGATASECAKALRAAGASRVFVAVFAR